MNKLLSLARDEFSAGLTDAGMKKIKGCFWIEMNKGFRFVVEPELYSRYGSVVFDCAVGLYSWRHQFLIDKTIADLHRSGMRTGDLKSIWYRHMTFGNAWYRFVSRDSVYDYLEDSAIAVKAAIKDRLSIVLCPINDVIAEAASDESLILIEPYLKYSVVYPVDMARCFLRTFFGQEDKLREELAYAARLESTMTRESYPIFSERLLSLCGSTTVDEVLACADQSELESVVFPPCFGS